MTDTTTTVPVVWERYDTETADGEDGYYGLVWTLESETADNDQIEVVYETSDWPLKSLVAADVARFMEANPQYRYLTNEENNSRFPWATY